MADENKTVEVPEVPPDYKWIPSRSGASPEIYTNYTHASWTKFDVRVRLGQLVPITGAIAAKDFVVEERAAVTFAWPLAKLLAIQLAHLVQSYEKENGEIVPLRLPRDPAALEK